MSTEQIDKSSLNDKRIVIFDGECAFCNASVRFIRNHNSKDNLFYCSSQSTLAQDILHKYPSSVSPEESLIYIKHGRIHYYSSAALEISKELDHYWAMISIFLIIPRKIRDGVYKIFAKNRKRILGETSSCSLEDSKKFEGRVLK